MDHETKIKTFGSSISTLSTKINTKTTPNITVSKKDAVIPDVFIL